MEPEENGGNTNFSGNGISQSYPNLNDNPNQANDAVADYGTTPIFSSSPADGSSSVAAQPAETPMAPSTVTPIAPAQPRADMVAPVQTNATSVDQPTAPITSTATDSATPLFPRTNHTAHIFGRSRSAQIKADASMSSAPTTVPVALNKNAPAFFNEAMTANAVVAENNAEQKKSKKKIIIIIGIILLVLAAIGATVAIILSKTGTSTNKDEKNISDLQTILDKDKDGVQDTYILIGGIYGGSLTADSFISSSNDEYNTSISEIEKDAASFKSMRDNINNFKPSINKTVEQIDIEKNLNGLKTALNNDSDKIQQALNLAKALKTAGKSGESTTAVDRMSDYKNSADVIAVAKAIDAYNSKNLEYQKYIATTNCSGKSATKCVDYESQVSNLLAALQDKNLLKKAFVSEVGDFTTSKNESAYYYLNNLIAATRSKK